jgi:DNA-directed RNA polymerase subunit M/transcription elongation factor TFIIS
MQGSPYREEAQARAAPAATPRCPNCGWRDVRFARLRGALDWTLRKLSVAAFRCRSCGHRFYRYHRAS